MEIVLPIIDPVEKWIKQRLLFQKNKKEHVVYSTPIKSKSKYS